MKILTFFLVLVSFARADFTLAWDDNSSNETGFIIQRSIGQGSSAFVEVGRVAANVLAYRDTTATGELTTYNYRVCAFKTAVPEITSGWSNVASVSTGLNGPTNARANQIITVNLARGATAQIIAAK